MVHVSVVIPVYNAELCLDELVRRLKKSLGEITTAYELILVNDASPDNAWGTIVDFANKDTRIKGINLSRNFGQHFALTAGLRHAMGEWIVVMDCDLQDQPEEVIKLYNKVKEGYDIVWARRIDRKDPFFKRLSSQLFHAVYSYLSGIKTDSTIANFGIFNQKVVREFNNMKETARSFPALVHYLGFKCCAVDVLHSQRFEGKTSYSFSKLINLTGDVILSNSNKPLKLTIKLGFCISLFSFLLALYNVVAHFMGIIKVPGFTTTIFSIWFVGGLILFVLGVIGLYIGKIFDQVKERQLFVVSNTVNITDEEITAK